MSDKDLHQIFGSLSVWGPHSTLLPGSPSSGDLSISREPTESAAYKAITLPAVRLL